MVRHSFLSLVRHALGNHRGWPRQWRKAQPKASYDVVIVGGGGHGLATAYYLASQYGITNVCVVEKGWLGGGNTARNTTIVRSNYLWPESARLYEQSLKLWEGLSAELNYNVMFSPRGLLTLAHTDHDLREGQRRVHANRCEGIGADWLTPDAVAALCPALNIKGARWPVLGASWQGRAGTARHDAVAWGFARAADALGVDIVENCPVTKVLREGDAVVGVETAKGTIRAKTVALVAAGHSSVLAETAGLRLPLQSRPLQALVSEPVKPVLDCVVMSNTAHVYLSQSDKGELVIGAGTDQFASYAQRGSFPVIEKQMSAVLELFPTFSRLRMLRAWGGIVDIAPDASPIIGETPVSGLYLNCGWGTGGFKATPVSGQVFAHHLATTTPHRLAEPFALTRFQTGALLDEHGAAGVAH